MKKFKYNMKNYLRKINGLDELNKFLLVASLILSLLATSFRSVIFEGIYLVVFAYTIFRFFSKKKYQRGEENRAYLRRVKLYKAKWEYRKTSRVYLCKNCSRLIKVPKSKGKIQTKCPHCGALEDHYS